MGTRSNIDRLKQIPSNTGRIIGEGGDILNQATYLSSDAFSSDRLMSVRGRLFFSTPRVSVPAGGSATISVNVSPNKYLVQYQREINVESAKWNVEGILDSTFTGGTSEQINNSFTASSFVNESSIIVNPVLTGGTTIQNLLIPAGERRSSGIVGAGTSFVVIYPPGTVSSIVLTHDDTVAREAQVVYEFAEITAEEFASIQDIFIG